MRQDRGKIILDNNYMLIVEKIVFNCFNFIIKGIFVIIDIFLGFEGILNFDSMM